MIVKFIIYVGERMNIAVQTSRCFVESLNISSNKKQIGVIRTFQTQCLTLLKIAILKSYTITNLRYKSYLRNPEPDSN